MIVFSGSMAVGAAAWGLLADLTTTPTSLLAAAALAGGGCLLAPYLPLATGELRDLASTKHMPVHDGQLGADDTGEVQVLVRYSIDATDEHEFMTLLQDVRRWRLRTGAHAWRLYRDFDRPYQWVESFVVSSWTEHLRQHTRTTEHDWASKEAAYRLHRGVEPPRVVHLIAPRVDGSIPTRHEQDERTTLERRDGHLKEAHP